MPRIKGTTHDYWMRKQRELREPVSRSSMAGNTGPLPPDKQPAPQPHANLVTDPMGDLARAEESFASSEVTAGNEMLREGRGIDNLVDLQNTDAAGSVPWQNATPEDPLTTNVTPAPTFQPPEGLDLNAADPLQQFDDLGGGVDPLNNLQDVLGAPVGGPFDPSGGFNPGG